MSSSLDRREPAKYILLEVKSDAFIIIHIFINILYQKFFPIWFKVLLYVLLLFDIIHTKINLL